MKRSYTCLLITLLLGLACSRPPQHALPAEATPLISPDYSGVTIPGNIAPLNFRIEEPGSSFRCVVSGDAGEPFSVSGREVRLPEKKWKALLEANKGGEIRFEVFVKRDGAWHAFIPVSNRVADEPVDGYLTYRLIEPTYGMAGRMSIVQRELSSFREKEVFNNQLDYDRSAGQCINCHSFQNWHTSRMQFHVRHKDGGTIIARDGDIRKLNLKAEGFLSAGVYPSWHPAEDLLAYSLNSTKQYFHSKGVDKTEVIDAASDIMLYDPVTNKASLIAADSLQYETFPYWAPDGKSLYYCVADISEIPGRSDIRFGVHYDELHYNLMQVPFNPDDRSFGEPRTVFDAAASGLSATFPRESPDGRYLLFTMASFGQFHIWHRDADLWLADLSTGEIRPLAEVNSDSSESYHSWSSNGRWIVFSSRRDDDSHTRFYLSYFDHEGNAHKPFLLPQRDPGRYARQYQSYNIPEFTVEPVTISPKRFLKTVRQPAVIAER